MENNYFDIVLDLQEKLARNEITFEEFEIEMSKLEPSSVQLETDNSELKSSMSVLENSIRAQNEFFKNYLGNLGEEIGATKKSSSDLKRLSEQIKLTLEPTVSEISSKVNKETISDVSNKLVGLGRKVLTGAPDKIKGLKDNFIPDKKSCEHELLYLSMEVSPYKFESSAFKNMSSTKLIVCKCLGCGKEIITSREKVGESLIETESDYSTVKAIYNKVKNKGLSIAEMKEEIYSKLNGEIKLTL